MVNGCVMKWYRMRVVMMVNGCVDEMVPDEGGDDGEWLCDEMM